MLIRIQSLLAPPFFEEEDKAQLARLLNLFLLTGVILSLLAAVVNSFISTSPTPRITLHAILILVFLGPYILLRHGHIYLASRILIYPLWLVITILIVASGGVFSPNMAGLILVMFVAGMLVGKRDGLIISALNIIVVVAVVLGEASNLLPTPAIGYSLLSNGAVITIFMVVAGLLLYLALSNLSNALAKIREHEQENRIITEEALAGVYIIQDGRLVYANPALQQITGYEVHELSGKPLLELIHPDDQDLVKNNIQRRTEDPTLRLSYSVRGIRKDGSTIHCEVMGRRVDYRGQPAIIGTLLDLTDRVKAEEAVRTSEEMNRNLVENVRDVIFTLSPSGIITSFNPAFEHITGWSRSEWLGVSFAKLIHPNDLPTAMKLLRSAVEEPPTHLFELRIVSRTGEIIFGEFLVTSQVRDGKMVGVLGIARDITERKRSEVELDRLLQAEHDQRQLAETLAGVTLSLAAQHTLPEVLDEILHQTQHIVAYKTANIVLLEGDQLFTVRWRGYDEFNSQELISNLVQRLSDFPVEQEAVSTGQPIAIHDTHQDKRWRVMVETAWIRSFLIVPIRLDKTVLGLLRLDGDTPGEFTPADGDRLGSLANAAAIALDNARLKDSVEAQALQLQQIVNTVRDGILLLDGERTIRLANPAAEQYLELLAGAKIGDTLDQLGDSPLHSLLELPRLGLPWHEVTMPEKQKYFSVTAKSLEIEHQVSGWVLVLRDITEEHERQQYILTQERLATVGQMAAGIAHDFNNILAVIELYAQLMLYTSTLSPKNRERLDIINQQSQRAASLIRQILDFSRRSLLEMKQMPLLPYLKELINLLQRALPENIAIQFNYEDRDLEVNADPARLQEALMNLAINARDAMPEGGSLNILLSRIEIEVGEKPPLLDMVPGEWACLQVEDSGTGIDPAHLEHMFEPFFTTKPPGQGTGLGLAQVYGIVRQHQGYIDVNSEVDRGTSFTIYLPAITPKPEKSQPETFAPVEGAGEKILVVEDESATREAISEVLEMLGYQVVIAKDGLEAQQRCLDANGQISLVISDLIMPGMSGEELHSWLRAQKPSVKMIAITGYPLEEGGKSLLEQGIVAWIQKPFTADSLADVVAKALAETEGRDKVAEITF